MKQSKFNYIIKQQEFKTGFQGALSLIVAEIVNWYTENDENGDYIRTKDNIDQWDYTRIEYAYKLAGADGNVNKLVFDLRPLFPVEEVVEGNDFYPFTLDEGNPNQNADGIPNIDDVEAILFERIKLGGYFNYWAKAKPEHVGKLWNGAEDTDGKITGGTMRE